MGSFIVCGFLFIILDVQWNLETKEQIYKTNINIPVLKLRRNILLPINLIHFSIFFFILVQVVSVHFAHTYTQSSEQNKKKLIINNITIITTKEAQINSINRNALHEYNFSGMSTRKHTRNQKFKFAYEKSVFFCFFHWFVYQSFAFACRTPLISQIVYVHALEMNLH